MNQEMMQESGNVSPKKSEDKILKERSLKDRRAPVVPRFLKDLHSLVSDVKTDEIVCWKTESDDHSFIIKDLE